MNPAGFCATHDDQHEVVPLDRRKLAVFSSAAYLRLGCVVHVEYEISSLGFGFRIEVLGFGLRISGLGFRVKG